MKKDRVVTGLLITIVYVAVFLLAMYVHPIFFDIFILLIAVCGACALLVLGMALSMGMILRGRRRRKRRLRRKR